jgi:hypothetical protein
VAVLHVDLAAVEAGLHQPVHRLFGKGAVFECTDGGMHVVLSLQHCWPLGRRAGRAGVVCGSRAG